MSVPQIRRIALALVAGAALATSAFAADSAAVSFINGSKHPMTILVRHGAEGDCGRRPQVERLTVAPGETGTVAGATGSVCYCLRPSNRRDICQDSWSEAKPGAQLQFK